VKLFEQDGELYVLAEGRRTPTVRYAAVTPIGITPYGVTKLTLVSLPYPHSEHWVDEEIAVGVAIQDVLRLQ
jgi:hypothetical protein